MTTQSWQPGPKRMPFWVKAVRLCAVVPAALAGSFIAIMGLGFLPGAGLVAAFALTALVALVLVAGYGEGVAARVLGLGRGLRPGEAALLEPTLRLLDRVELEPWRVLVKMVTSGDEPAVPIGRDTVLIDPGVVTALYQRGLVTADVAAVIGHAVARQRVGPAATDLAARLWAAPWSLLYGVIQGIARVFSWVPAGGLAWRLRGSLGVVALWQGFQPGGSPVLGIATFTLIAVSYVAPWANRTWRAAVERVADQILAARGLADPLVHYAQWRGGDRSLERVHRIRRAQHAPTSSSTDRSAAPRVLTPAALSGSAPASSTPVR